MESHKIYISKDNVITLGFTLMEVLVVLGMLAIIAGCTLLVSNSFIQDRRLAQERATLVGLLQTARSHALQHTGGVAHGVAIDPTGTASFVLFRGDSYETSVTESQIIVPRMDGVEIVQPVPAEIVFQPIRADTTFQGTLLLRDQIRLTVSTTININHVGAIY